MLNALEIPRPTETPNHIAELMVQIADVQKGSTVLEPSAGFGKIALVASAAGALVTCVELNQNCFDVLQSYKYFHNVIHKDFLKYKSDERFNAVLMCPPRNSIPHIDHAYTFLKENGVLVALIRRDTEGIEKYLSHYFALPPESFMMDGEYVSTGLITLRK